MLYDLTYSAFGRVFRAERSMATGLWWAVGRAPGAAPYRLDKVGSRETREEMQAALDAWAKRMGLKPRAVESAGAAACGVAGNSEAGRAEQAELFGSGVMR
jgi:hypothetical protein